MMKQQLTSLIDTLTLGERIGTVLRGGECIELIGDVGTGKTTLTKGIAKGLDIDEDVQSPSFTISREYDARDGLTLAHYDFYRLDEPGIMSYGLAESLTGSDRVTIIEWADSVADVLPSQRITIRLMYDATGNGRIATLDSSDTYDYIKDAL